MTVAFYLNCVSAHQLPLAKEVAQRVDEFVYIDAGEKSESGQQVDAEKVGVHILNLKDDSSAVQLQLETSTFVYTGMRDLELLEKRARAGKTTYYYSERWFKPIRGLPGSLRMLVPSYRKMAKRFVKWANSDPNARVLAVGPWAKKDFLRMGVRADKLVPWGYFVSAGVEKRCRCRKEGEPLKVLWVGRNLAWKRVGDIEKAVTLANKKLISALHLHLESTPIAFTKLTGVTPSEVRAAMRSHDLYVLASNAEEGWGAALNEALEEGMNAIGTFEAGASAAMLPRARLYHAGDIGALAKLLEAEYRGERPPCTIGDWTAAKAAERLLNL